MQQIEIRVSVAEYWKPVGVYNVLNIPQVGDHISATGNISDGYYTGVVAGIRHDLDTGDVIIKIV